jgi:predicted CoA-binding protein
MATVRELLETASIIELVDWPNQEVPATLFRAGYSVVGHEPRGYQSYMVAPSPAKDTSIRSFPLADGAHLVSYPIDALPSGIDIVNTYRPAEEQPDIARGAILLGARAFWVQPGEKTSDEARKIAIGAGLVFIDGVCIAETVRKLGISKPSRA